MVPYNAHTTESLLKKITRFASLLSYKILPSSVYATASYNDRPTVFRFTVCGPNNDRRSYR
jgi:hypothetical protein